MTEVIHRDFQILRAVLAPCLAGVPDFSQELMGETALARFFHPLFTPLLPVR